MEAKGLKTLFIDIDGTLLYHNGIMNQQTKFRPILLPGVEKKLEEWEEKGYRIILVTGRKESERKETVRQLALANIQYDHLIMGICRGDRVLINDLKPETDEPTAIAINIKRNEGLENIEI